MKKAKILLDIAEIVVDIALIVVILQGRKKKEQEK